MADERTLPGWPKKSLVRSVKRWLRGFGISPALSALWREAWAWADRIASGYFRHTWPLASEIAAQYVFLLVLDMHGQRALKLPYRAAAQAPQALRDRIALAGGRPRLPLLDDRTA